MFKGLATLPSDPAAVQVAVACDDLWTAPKQCTLQGQPVLILLRNLCTRQGTLAIKQTARGRS